MHVVSTVAACVYCELGLLLSPLSFPLSNVTWTEALGTVLLASLVCVVGALLLSLVDYYQGVTVVIFCYVVATAHFSLIKVRRLLLECCYWF